MAELHDSIAFLQKTNTNGHNLYDHLSEVLLKLLETKPHNAYDVFEHISVDVKRGAFTTPESEQVSPEKGDGFQAIETPENLQMARVHINLLKSESSEPVSDDQGLTSESEVPNLLDEANALEWAGVGINREDLYRLQFSISQLMESHPLKTARLFGKIFGLQKDYYILESEFKDGEGDILPGTPPPEQPPKRDEDDSEEEAEEAEEKPKPENPIPQIALPQEPTIPSEEFTGTNKYIYWVCNEIGEEWERLPNVTPSQIAISRKIHKYLTGDLNAVVKSCPTFPGKERNYLRAQIARISSATSLSPKGYLMFEDEDEEGADEDVVLVNDPEFAGHAPVTMLELGNWVHSSEYILPQGRCSYYRIPKTRNPEDEEEEAYEEDEEEEEEGEVGPRILTEISADTPVGSTPAWIARLSHQFGKRPTVAYSTDPTEETDPTLEEEQEVQRQNEAAQPQTEGEETGEGEGEEEEGEELEGEEGEDGEDGGEYDDDQA